MAQLKKILLVDDDEDLREALSEQLVMTEDFDVFEADSGQTAMERAKEALYDLVILTDWNWPYPVKGRGSAIFLHRWRRPGYPTEGCVAFRPDHLRQIAQAGTPCATLSPDLARALFDNSNSTEAHHAFEATCQSNK